MGELRSTLGHEKRITGRRVETKRFIFKRDPMMKERGRVWVVWFFVGAAGLAFFLSQRHGEARAGGITPVAMRRAALNMTFEKINGGKWRLQEHRGQVVLINLWASWCGPCREETPGLVRLYREDGAKGLEVVGLSLDVGGRDNVRAFVQRFEVPYPIVFPEPMSQLADTVEGVPTTILVDKDGRVAKTYVGAVRREVFAADVEELLAESEVAAGL
jgi:cytochrome c biogenesis protein CcmG, thiol:disulfide interchange protein DsbE